MDETRTIRVTGRGTLKLRPDLTRLTLTLQDKDPDYGETLRKSAEATAALRTVLEGLGFAAEELKTLSFSVDTLYEGFQDADGVYRNRFIGYQFQHVLKLEFAPDNALLGRALYALAHSEARPEMRIAYTVADQEAAKRALLEQAVRDARAKAEILSAAAGCALGRLHAIDYSFGELEAAVQPMRKMLAAEACADNAAGSYALDLTPDDIRVSDTVTLVWEIGGNE